MEPLCSLLLSRLRNCSRDYVIPLWSSLASLRAVQSPGHQRSLLRWLQRVLGMDCGAAEQRLCSFLALDLTSFPELMRTAASELGAPFSSLSLSVATPRFPAAPFFSSFMFSVGCTAEQRARRLETPEARKLVLPSTLASNLSMPRIH